MLLYFWSGDVYMKKIIIISSLFVILVSSFSLFLIFGKDDEKDSVKIDDYSYVNVESLKTSDVNTLDVNDFIIKDARINKGYLEGIFFNNSEQSYEVLNIIISLYDEDGNILDEINFEFKDISSYEERDLFYPIQKDLSNAYYIGVKEG